MVQSAAVRVLLLCAQRHPLRKLLLPLCLLSRLVPCCACCAHAVCAAPHQILHVAHLQG